MKPIRQQDGSIFMAQRESVYLSVPSYWLIDDQLSNLMKLIELKTLEQSAFRQFQERDVRLEPTDPTLYDQELLSEIIQTSPLQEQNTFLIELKKSLYLIFIPPQMGNIYILYICLWYKNYLKDYIK
ncbi:hypothetical protein pb186bvf_019898 [Paramecium bursaria]